MVGEKGGTKVFRRVFAQLAQLTNDGVQYWSSMPLYELEIWLADMQQEEEAIE